MVGYIRYEESRNRLKPRRASPRLRCPSVPCWLNCHTCSFCVHNKLSRRFLWVVFVQKSALSRVLCRRRVGFRPSSLRLFRRFLSLSFVFPLFCFFCCSYVYVYILRKCLSVVAYLRDAALSSSEWVYAFFLVFCPPFPISASSNYQFSFRICQLPWKRRACVTALARIKVDFCFLTPLCSQSNF